LLLDRRKIRRWAKWVALILAAIFAISFVFIGVGQGQGNLNVFDALSCSGNSNGTQTNTVDQQIAAYQATLQTDPKNADALIGLANVYQQLADSGQGDVTASLTESAKYLEQYIEADPTQIDVYLRLAKLYMGSTLNDNQSAADVLNRAATQDPSNSDVFLQLGVAERALGNKTAAVLAWQKYLQLSPNGDQADAVKQGIAQLEATTTTAASTTTGGSSTTGTAATTTTSTASTTTTAQ
jgi:cytochrome c-type biogenesis protein CcmH/NrfG